ncbi:TIGR00730 family Rossman fold protein [Brackiella oedipodis]|uniref:LOG family protein n=1 Tax=Brackiella oedipodis TaxID=124225 RepID=UPI00056F4094|nr:TIGR00730 family Rossman fold protein [Brackiella oedipodis]
MSNTTKNTIQEQIKEINQELLTAAAHLKGLKSAVSIFGSARTVKNTHYYNQAKEISKLLSEAGFSIISGGGPGIMEAANQGCFEANGHSIGLNIQLPHEQKGNQYQSTSLYFKYFTSRKTTFFMNSAAYVIMPGGFGTLDELFEALTLIQTHKSPPAPIVFYGRAYWQGLLDWIHQVVLDQHGYINAEDIELYHLTDDPHEVVQYIIEERQKIQEQSDLEVYPYSL